MALASLEGVLDTPLKGTVRNLSWIIAHRYFQKSTGKRGIVEDIPDFFHHAPYLDEHTSNK